MATTSEVSRGACSVLARSSQVALLGASPADKVIANSVLSMNTTCRPKRFFTSREEAMEWLLKGATP
ncbi:DUF7793 family protein [Pseudarthrobacter phenanthrenivorans]|uniref:DUF7793 family protein n=1 Tax=Pseudarthrobacter phenanthrenivorans TaxID=361575 RepID=UPI003F554D0C